ncbi:hypothetical protein BP6252_13273 [Coleophoma cylindrospora]|uniref:DUF7779 domain-containing protein n=1 Tax=Coleophoma cylindrospora TaxID=1849047 RepID=A0A3D8QAT5_9HELO|nr:hypothetical protein BP6252_13273 [Coleophoma cylindrospora]
MGPPPVPTSRNDFKIAIICALTREVDAVEALFQLNWERNGDRSLPKRFTKALGDRNSYSFGYMSDHNVVLAWTPNMGPTAAASTASSLRSSFPSIRLVLLVGICGAVPEYKQEGITTQIFLGDIIVSNGLVPYASVKSYPGESVMRTTLPGPNTEIQAALSHMMHLSSRIMLLEEIPHHLDQLLSRHVELQKEYCFPGRECDKLFDTNYIHKHHDACDTCQSSDDNSVCDEARHRSCAELECDEERHLVLRPAEQRKSRDEPAIHYGRIGSGDTVMKSGHHRDEIASQHGIIAFEMEGLGIWENLPTLVVKGACDYSDSHKNKNWQNYAAATAASYAASFLKLWRAEDVAAMPTSPFIQVNEQCLPDDEQNKRHFIAPRRNQNYVSRSEVREEIQRLIDTQEGSHVRICICGLGGTGKTQIAMNFAHTRDSTTHVFWIHSATLEHFYADYFKLGSISNTLESTGTANEKCDAIREWLDSNKSGEWVLILDNLDTLSPIILSVLTEVLPRQRGMILITSVNSQVEGSLIDVGFVIHLGEMSLLQAKETFRKMSGLSEAESNSVTTVSLLKQLGNLPLAIAQAAAYIRGMKQKTAMKYLAEIQSSEERKIALLQRTFKDYHSTISRFSQAEIREMSVMTTWEMPFEHIKSSNASAIRLLQVMSLLDCQNIPNLLLTTTQALEVIGIENESQLHTAIEDLLKFALITVSGDDFSPSYQIHRLVSLWTRKTARCMDNIVKATLNMVYELFPETGDRSFPEWSHILPHANSVVSFANRPEFLDQCTALNYKISQFYLYAGDYSKSELLILKCYEQFLAREGCLEEVFWCMYHMGDLKLRQGLYLESQTWNYKAKRASQELFDSQHPVLMEIEVHLALSLFYLEDLEGAIQKYNHVLQQKKVEDETSLRVHGNMGSVFLRQGKGEEAIKQYHQAAQGWENLSGLENIETLVAKGALAAAYQTQNHFTMAIEIFEEVVPSLVAKLGEDHPRTLEISSHMAVCLKNQGLYEEASQLYEKVWAGQARKLGNTHRLTLNTLHNMGEAFLKWEKYDQALRCFDQVLKGRIIESQGGGGQLPQVYYATLDSIGDTYKAQKLYDKAVDYYQRAWEGAEKLSAENHPFFLDVLQRKSEVLVSQKKYEEAFNCLSTVFKGRVSIYEGGHMKLKETCNKIAEVTEKMVYS